MGKYSWLLLFFSSAIWRTKTLGEWADQQNVGRGRYILRSWMPHSSASLWVFLGTLSAFRSRHEASTNTLTYNRWDVTAPLPGSHLFIQELILIHLLLNLGTSGWTNRSGHWTHVGHFLTQGRLLGYWHHFRIPVCQGHPERGVDLDLSANVPMKITRKGRLLCWHLPCTFLDRIINRTQAPEFWCCKKIGVLSLAPWSQAHLGLPCGTGQPPPCLI